MARDLQKQKNDPAREIQAEIDRCVRGDRNAWDSFVDRFSGLIYATVIRTVRRYAKSRYEDEIEDITQEVFVKLIKNDFFLLRAYDVRKASFSTWVSVVAHSVSIDYLRKSPRESLLSDNEKLKTLPMANESSRENIEFVHHSLSPRQQLVLHLLYDKDMDVSEVARVLKVKEQTVRSTKHKAIEKLRKNLDQKRDI